MLEGIREFQIIQEICKTELQELERFRVLQSREPILDTCSDWGLKRWEESLGITPSGDRQDRIARVKSRLVNNQLLNEEWLTFKILSFVEVGQVVGTGFDMKTDTLTIYYYSNTTKNLTYIYEELRRLIPAHLLLKVVGSEKEKETSFVTSIYREYRREI